MLKEVKFLLKNGTDVTASSSLKNCLHNLGHSRNTNILRCLLEHGADPYARIGTLKFPILYSYTNKEYHEGIRVLCNHERAKTIYQIKSIIAAWTRKICYYWPHVLNKEVWQYVGNPLCLSQNKNGERALMWAKMDCNWASKSSTSLRKVYLNNLKISIDLLTRAERLEKL